MVERTSKVALAPLSNEDDPTWKVCLDWFSLGVPSLAAVVYGVYLLATQATLVGGLVGFGVALLFCCFMWAVFRYIMRN